MPNWKKLIVSGSDASLSTLTITNSGSTDDSLLLTATEDSSTAAPVATFKRNSSSPGDADYLGQLKFKGENDADQEVVYAKITAKIQDASDGSEDGLIEFANKKAGSNNITARLRSDKLQLINGTELEVDGQVSASSFIGDGSGLTGLVSGTTNYVPIYDSSGITESLISQSTYGEENDTQVVIAAQRTFINSQVVTTTYSSPSGTALRLGGIGNTNEIRIEGADIESATDAAKKILTVGQDGQIHTADGNESISGSFSGSFIGDGSGLTGLVSTIQSSSTAADSFTSATTHSVSHNLGTLSPFVQVYDDNNELFIPTKVKVVNSDTVTIFMDPATSGKVTIADAGHIISGSGDYSLLINTPSGIVSGAAQTVAHLPTNTVSGSAQVVSLLSGQNLTLGEVSASKIHTTVVSSSIAFSSGSNIFGDELTDVHQITGSLNVTGSANLVASQSVNTRDDSSLGMWAGSQAQYDALGSYNSNTIYFVT